jgi:hypothetical protein
MKGRNMTAVHALISAILWSSVSGVESLSSMRRQDSQIAMGNCSKTVSPQRFLSEYILKGSNKLEMVGIRGISNSIGYSVIDSVEIEQAAESTEESCGVKMANVINLYGNSVAASAAGAQAAVRGTNFQDPAIQSCSGFGLCANIWDGVGQDVYPIATLTYVVVPTKVTDTECKMMKIVYEYMRWILFDPAASTIASLQGFATMPKKVASLASAQILDQMRCQNADSSTYRYVKDEPTPTTQMRVLGSGSSLQANLQSQLLRNYPNAGMDRMDRLAT